MQNTWRLIKLSLALLVISGTEGEIYCRDGWLHATVTGTEQDICVNVNVQADTWRASRDYCIGMLGELLNIDLQISLANSTDLLDYIKQNGLTTIWTGMHIDEKTGWLIWDDLLDTKVPDSDTRRNWQWLRNQPDYTGGCGCLDIPQDTTDVTNNAYLCNCSRQLPAICVAERINTQWIFGSACPLYWIGHRYMEKCYRIFVNRVTRSEAKRECSRQKGRLALINYGYRWMILEVYLRYIIKQAQSYDKIVYESIWIDTSDADNCSYIRGQLQESQVVLNTYTATQCTQLLHYACERSTVSFESEILLKVMPSNEQGQLYGKQAVCEVSRGLTGVESLRFFVNNVVVPSSQYTEIPTTDSAYTVSIFLPFSSNYEINYSSIGYIRCEIVSTNPRRHLNSEEVLLTYPDSDLLMYASYIIISESSRPPATDIARYNLMGYATDRVTSIQNNLSLLVRTALRRLMVDSPEIFISRTMFSNFSRDGSVIYFTIFLHQSNEAISTEKNQWFLDELPEAVNTVLDQDIGNAYGFVSDSVELQTATSCLSFTLEKEGEVYEFKTASLFDSGYSQQVCITDKRPKASSNCVGSTYTGAYWEPVAINPNCSFSSLARSEVSNTLQALSEVDVTNDSTVVLTETLSVITSNVNLTSIDIIHVGEIFSNAADSLESTPSETFVDIVDTINTIANVPTSVLNEAQASGSATNRIIEAVELMGSNIDLEGNSNLRIVRDNIAVEVWDISRPDVSVVGLQLTGQQGDVNDIILDDRLKTLRSNDTLNYGTIDVAILLPHAVLESNNSKLFMQIHGGSSLFSGTESSAFRANSKVVSATLTDSHGIVTDLQAGNVTVVVRPWETGPDPVCGFWDTTALDTAGDWSTEGCMFVKTVDGCHVCTCNHLTNFALLLDFDGTDLPPEHELALGLITIIGLSLSIAGLSFTIISFLWFSNLRKGRAQQTLFNLALAMVFSWIVFLAGIKQTSNYAGCIIVAALLHYFILATFMWMLMEGVLQYLRYVKVLGTYFPRYMLKTALPAWGIPLLPVVTVLAIDYNLYRGSEKYCWMSLQPLYFAFALPLGLILLINIILFIIVAVHLAKRPKLKSNQSERKAAVLSIRAGISVLVLLGLTWIFGFFAISDARLAFQYLFTILNVFQGFFIFILFTARQPQVRRYWRNLCCPGSIRWQQSSTQRTSNTYPGTKRVTS